MRLHIILFLPCTMNKNRRQIFKLKNQFYQHEFNIVTEIPMMVKSHEDEKC